MNKIKRKGAPACGLYIRLPAGFNFDDVQPGLRQLFFAVNGSDYERNMHAIEIAYEPDTDPQEFKDKAMAVVELVKANGFAVIVRENADVAREIDADGVLLELGKKEEISRAKELMGEEGIVGMRCGLFEELGEESIKRGVDYVSFSFPDGALPPESTVAWWVTKSHLPALVEGEINNDNCYDYVKAGAMLLDCSHYIWSHPKGVMQGAVNMLYAIDLALEQIAAH